MEGIQSTTEALGGIQAGITQIAKRNERIAMAQLRRPLDNEDEPNQCPDLHPMAEIRSMTSMFENPYISALKRDVFQNMDADISEIFFHNRYDGGLEKLPISVIERRMDNASKAEKLIGETVAGLAVIYLELEEIRAQNRPLSHRYRERVKNIHRCWFSDTSVYRNNAAFALARRHAAALTGPWLLDQPERKWSKDGIYLGMNGVYDEELRQKDVDVCRGRLKNAIEEFKIFRSIATVFVVDLQKNIDARPKRERQVREQEIKEEAVEEETLGKNPKRKRV